MKSSLINKNKVTTERNEFEAKPVLIADNNEFAQSYRANLTQDKKIKRNNKFVFLNG
jgi:hypothetical protein